MRVWLFFQVCHLDHPSCQPRVRGSLECTAKKGNDDYKVQLWIPTILTGTRVSSNFLLEVFQGKEIGQNGVAFPRRGEFTKRSKQIWVSEGQTLFDCVVCPPDLSEVQVIYFLKNAPDQRELFDQVLSQGQTISSDWSLQGYIASTPLPHLEHYFRTPCRLAEATVATLSQFESSFCSVPLPLCYSINCLQISPSPRVLHLWIQLDIILSFILYML